MQVDRANAVPFLKGAFGGRGTAPLNSGIVNPVVEPPKFVHRSLEEFPHLICVGYVGGHEDCASAAGNDAIGYGTAFFLSSCGEHDGSTLARESLGCRFPYA